MTVPSGDDRPEPLFDALWDALRFQDDRAAAHAALLASRAKDGETVHYQADVAPRSAVADHLEGLGGVAAAHQTPLPNGTVRLAWTGWTYEVSVMVHDWRPPEGPVHRVDSMPHGPLAVLVPAGLGWSAADAEAWLRERGAEHGLPTDGVALERVATAPCA